MAVDLEKPIMGAAAKAIPQKGCASLGHGVSGIVVQIKGQPICEPEGKGKQKRQKLDHSYSNGAPLTLKGKQERRPRRGYHVPGRRLVSKDEYALLSVQMRSLHDKIMKLEKDGSKSSHFMGKVPKDYNFFTEDIACKFTLEFSYIFCMFNLGMLGASLVRLWALYQAKEARRNKAPVLDVIDPFHFQEDNLNNDSDREMITEWLCNAM